MSIALLLSKIKLQHILIILIIAMGFALFTIWNQMMFHKYESIRKGDNTRALIELQEEKTAHLEFRTTREIEDYVESEQELKDLLEDANVKLRRANNIIWQKQTYIDNMERSTDVSSLIENIRKNIQATEKWSDSTECLVLGGNVEFKDNTLRVNVTEREFNNSIAIVSDWERVPGTWIAKVLGLGRKVPSVTATSACGESKTVVIERTKND